MSTNPRKLWLGVTEGMSGWFAVLYDDGGAIETGIGRYATMAEAENEAREWSLSERVYVDFDQDHNLRLVSHAD